MSDERLLVYLREVGVRETPVMRANREATAAAGHAHLQIAPEQGQLIALLVTAIGARRGIEIGVFAGYSALWLAGALPADGDLLACDNDDEITVRARRAWAEAGIADRVRLKIAPALETLAAEIAVGMSGVYDFVLIDADKKHYLDYYEHALTLLRTGGLVLADNTLWHGRVIDPDDDRVDTTAIRAFNRRLHADARVDISMVAAGDGLTVARKR